MTGALRRAVLTATHHLTQFLSGHPSLGDAQEVWPFIGRRSHTPPPLPAKGERQRERAATSGECEKQVLRRQGGVAPALLTLSPFPKHCRQFTSGRGVTVGRPVTCMPFFCFSSFPSFNSGRKSRLEKAKHGLANDGNGLTVERETSRWRLMPQHTES